MKKPTTASEAFENGSFCRREGHSVHYNPYRNMGVEAAELNAAWIDGWESADKDIENA